MSNIKEMIKEAAVAATAKKEMKEVELKIRVNGISSRRSIKKVSEDNGIPMNDVFVRINFIVEGQDNNVTYTASQRLSSLGKLYLELEQEVNKPESDKKIYSVTLKQYKDDKEDNGAFINFLPDVAEDEFMSALTPQTDKKKGNPSDLFK